MRSRDKSRRAGFTMVELLVVIGLIAMLISLLMPALNRIRQTSLSLKCKAQMKDIGNQLYIYSLNNNQWPYPVGDFVEPGTRDRGRIVPPPGYYKTLGHEPGERNDKGEIDDGKSRRWPVFVFPDLAIWNPPIMTCPSDQDPVEDHTYILNKHLADKKNKLVMIHTSVPGRSASEVLLMGEKRIASHDYYMGRKETDSLDSEFDIVEPYKHGLKLGSNYLFMDRHVELFPPSQMAATQDPWDVNLGDDNPDTVTTDSGSGTAQTPVQQVGQ